MDVRKREKKRKDRERGREVVKIYLVEYDLHPSAHGTGSDKTRSKDNTITS